MKTVKAPEEVLTPETITHEILYSPVTNGKADASIKNGIGLIERYASQETALAIQPLLDKIAELERILSVRDLQVDALVMQLETNNLKPII